MEVSDWHVRLELSCRRPALTAAAACKDVEADLGDGVLSRGNEVPSFGIDMACANPDAGDMVD
jgi:hypothetical protein